MPPITRQVKSLGPFGKGGLGGIFFLGGLSPPSPCLEPPLLGMAALCIAPCGENRPYDVQA